MSFIEALLLPPASTLAWLLLALAAPQRLRSMLVTSAVLLLWLSTLPLTTQWLAARYQATALTSLPVAQAGDIVLVLAGGLHEPTPEYPTGAPSMATLGRLRYGVHLAQHLESPLLVSGGQRPQQGLGHNEAQAMADIARHDFAFASRIFTEDRSQTTWENALYSVPLVHRHGFKRVFLVTSAVHMPRAREAFARFGLDTVAAPTLFLPQRPNPLQLRQWLPSMNAANALRALLHEWLGRAWYGLHDQVSQRFNRSAL